MNKPRFALRIGAWQFYENVRRVSGIRNCVDADDLAVATTALELDLAVDEREESIIATLADVLSWMELGTTLTNEDAACTHDLATETLYTEILRI